MSDPDDITEAFCLAVEAEITALRVRVAELEATLADMLPLAERYVGRSNGQPNAIYDALARARAALAKEEKE